MAKARTIGRDAGPANFEAPRRARSSRKIISPVQVVSRRADSPDTTSGTELDIVTDCFSSAVGSSNWPTHSLDLSMTTLSQSVQQ